MICPGDSYQRGAGTPFIVTEVSAIDIGRGSAEALAVIAARFDPNQSDYLSEKDPFSGSTPLESQKAKLFPSDPGLDNHEYSPFRISFSYILNFIRADKIAVKPWYETRQDPRIGELADEWLGNVDPGTSFQAKVSGRVLRIGTDGAVYQLRDRGGPKPLGNANDLFIKR